MNSNALSLALKQASRQLSVDPRLVEDVYRSYWKFIKEHVESMYMKQMTKDKFETLTTNFNIPYIGKLYADYDKIDKYNRQLKFYKDVKAKKNQADRHKDSGNC